MVSGSKNEQNINERGDLSDIDAVHQVCLRNLVTSLVLVGEPHGQVVEVDHYRKHDWAGTSLWCMLHLHAAVLLLRFLFQIELIQQCC